MIDMYYLYLLELLEAMKMGTENFKFISHEKYVPIPGWNIYCKNKYSIAREAFLKWGNKIRRCLRS